MACTKNLFEILGGTPLTGGTWVYDPLDVSGGVSITGDWAGSGSANGSATYAPTNPVPGDDSLTFTPNASTVDGTYLFQYSATGGCTTPAVATLNIVAGVVVGGNVSVSLCDNDLVEYNLMTLATTIGAGSQNGKWTSPTYNSLGHCAGGITGGICDPDTPDDATDDVFVANNSVPGTYTFNYKVDNGTQSPPNAGTYGQDSCEDCVGEMTLIIEVTALADSGDDAEFTICNEFTAT